MKLHFPPVGQRIVRSVAAVALCFCIYFIRNREGIPFYSALAVLQCIQPYQDSTSEVARKRVTGTFVGAFWGLVVILIQSYAFQGRIRGTLAGYLLVSVMTGVVIYSTLVLNCRNTAYFSCVVFLSITVMHMTDANPFLFVWNRVLDTLIGVGIALAVNAVHLPRIKKKDVLFVSGVDDTILNRRDEMSAYSKVELNRLIDSGANFTVSTNRTPATVRESLPGIHLKLPIIAMDGAVLYDPAENTFLMKYEMSPAQARQISTFLDEKKIHYFSNCIIENLLVIYYDVLETDVQKKVFETRRKSPYRNYVHRQEQVCENLVYIYLIEEKAKTQALYEELMRQPWIGEYRLSMHDSVRHPGCSNIKIYHRDATRENMLKNLQALLNIEKTVTFGSIEGKYDVFVQDPGRDSMVRMLKKLYEPVAVPGKGKNILYSTAERE